MIKTAIISCLVAVSVAAPQKDLPVLFQFQQPTHNVAVFRGADLKKAIASGLVKGYPGASGSAGAVATKTVVAPVVHQAPVVRVAHTPFVHRVAPAYPTPVVHPVAHHVHPVAHHAVVAPVVAHTVHATPSYAPAPVVVKAAPSYAPAPYVDQYADEPAVYNY